MLRGGECGLREDSGCGWQGKPGLAFILNLRASLWHVKNLSETADRVGGRS